MTSHAIHPTAIIAAGARLAEGVQVGPYSVIGPDVQIGPDTRIGSHVVIEGHTRIGAHNQIYQFASVGAAPQDLKFRGEPSELLIGDSNIIREFTTLQPGTQGGGMKTQIGNSNLFMAYSHVGHDSIIGNSNIFANAATAAGHIHVGDFVTLGGLTAIHQFCKLGDYSFIGGGAMVSKDIPPYCMAQGDRAELVGLNTVGLKRHGFSSEDIKILRQIYRQLFSKEGHFSLRLQKLSQEHMAHEKARVFLEFVSQSERGVAFPRRASEAESLV